MTLSLLASRRRRRDPAAAAVAGLAHGGAAARRLPSNGLVAARPRAGRRCRCVGPAVLVGAFAVAVAVFLELRRGTDEAPSS